VRANLLLSVHIICNVITANTQGQKDMEVCKNVHDMCLRNLSLRREMKESGNRVLTRTSGGDRVRN
jgi:hypothetical protein